MLFVLIKAAPTLEEQIGENLKGIDGVSEVSLLFGEFDLIAKLQGEDHNALGEVVVDRIRSMEGVEATRTFTKIEPKYEKK